VYAVDVSPWPRCDAEANPGRGYLYHQSRHSAGRPDQRHAPLPRGSPAARDRPCWSWHLGVCLHSGYYPDTFQPRKPPAPQWGSDSYQLRSPPISPPPYAAPLPQSSPIAQLLLRKGASARQSPHSAVRWSPRESRCVPVALGNEKALVCSGTSPKRGRSNCGIFARSLPTASWAIGEVSVEPSIRAFSICRSELPMMSVEREASFIFASSSVLCSLLTSAERSCSRVVR
jgi:hypothetical protein